MLLSTKKSRRKEAYGKTHLSLPETRKSNVDGRLPKLLSDGSSGSNAKLVALRHIGS